MRLKANNIVLRALLLMTFGLDAKTQIPTTLTEAKLLSESYLAVRLQMRSEVTR